MEMPHHYIHDAVHRNQANEAPRKNNYPSCGHLSQYNQQIVSSMLYNIQIARLVSLSFVAIAHIFWTGRNYNQASHYGIIIDNYSHNFVDLFLVISGFIIYYVQFKNGKTPFPFIKDRLIRIIPIYWILTFALVAIALTWPTIFNSLHLDQDKIIKSFLFCYSIANREHPVIYLGWSLELEFVFYVVFFAAMILTKSKSPLYSTCAIILGLTLFGFVKPIILEFALGMICCKIYLDGYMNKYRNVFLVTGVFLILISPLFDIQYYEYLKRVFAWGIPSSLIIFWAATCRQTRENIFTEIAKSSYSIYLVQAFTIPAFYKFSSKFLPSAQGDILALVCFVFTIGSGIAFYHAVEAPVTRALKRLTAGFPSARPVTVGDA